MDRRDREYRRKRKIIMNTQSVCAICGRLVDMDLKAPDPMSPTVDHIVPLNKGGRNDINNLQLAHWICNRMKSDNIDMQAKPNAIQSIRVSRDWKNF